MPVDLANGVTVQVAAPVLPSIRVTPPQSSTVAVLPVAGPAGPPGTAGGYTFTQSIAQAVWQVNHQLGRYPVAWSLYDAVGRLCDEYIVDHIDLNNCRVSMDTPTAGLIRLI